VATQPRGLTSTRSRPVIPIGEMSPPTTAPSRQASLFITPCIVIP
jgi:hypothetical protein